MKGGLAARAAGRALWLAAWAGMFPGAILLAVGAMPPRAGAQAAPQEQADNEAATRQYAAAAALQNREQYDLAADEWSEFLSDWPDDDRAGRAQHYLGICRLKTKDYPAALAAFEKVLSDYPKADVLASTRLHLGLAHYNLAVGGEAAHYDQAAAAFADLIDRYSQGNEAQSTEAAQARFYWGESLYAQGKKQEAVGQYAQLIENHAGDALVDDAMYAMGVAQEELGDAAAAGRTYDAYLKQFDKQPLAAEVGLRRGETLAAQGEFDAAAKWFAAASNRKGFALADLALMRQAAMLYQTRQYAEAARLYASLGDRFAESSHKGEAALAAGKCHFLAGDFDQARQVLAGPAAAGGAQAAEAAHWLARCHIKQGQPAEALRVVSTAIDAAAGGPMAAALEMDRADALYEIPDRRAEAIALYAAVAERHPDDEVAPQALYMASFAALSAGEHQPALGYAVKFMKRYADHQLTPDVTYVAAESYLQLGKYAEAGRLYKHLLDQHPDHAEAATWQVRRGLSLYLDKKYEDAVGVLSSVLPAIRSAELAAEAHYVIGSSQNELGQFAEAARSFAESLRKSAGWRQADETLLGLAHAHKQLNDLDQARQALGHLIERYPQSAVLDRAHYRLGEYAYAAGDFAAAETQYRKLLEDFSGSPLVPQALHALGWAQISQKDHAAAEQSFDGLLALASDEELAGRARYARGLARQQLSQYEGAIEDLRQFLAQRPQAAERSDARYVLALCLSGTDKHQEAATVLRELLEQDPQYAGADKALYELGWALESLGQMDAAAEAFGRLATQHSASPLAAEARYHVAEQRYEQGDYKQAAAAYYAVMQAAGKTDLAEKAAHKLGWAYFKQDIFDKARQAFAWQRSNYPQGPLASDAAFMEGEALFKQGEYADALVAYGAVGDRQTGNGQTGNGETGEGGTRDFAVLTLLHSGQAAGQLKQWDKSLELLERANAEHRESAWLPEILYEKAWALQNLGRLDQALKAYEAVTGETDREVAARARFMIGEIHFEKREHAEAIRNFFKVAFGYSYPTWQANAHYEAGRCFEVLGKLDQARKSYQEVVDQFPDSDKAALARDRLAALKS